MIIKNLSCDQFAGVNDKDIALSNGMNVIVGKNETGKSTLVDLMYQTLFSPAKVGKGKPFESLYFPQRATGVKADIVDGSITFETSDGTYKLKKEWELGGGTCRLILPDGTIIRGEDAVNEILSQQLKYGQGVYDEMVFPSQKRDTNILKSIFQSSDVQKKTEDKSLSAKNEISSIITKAVMETGGISINTLEKKIKDKLLQYDDCWDSESDMPKGGIKRGINNKWAVATSAAAVKNDSAILLRAYYDKEEAANNLRNAIKAEKEIDELNKRLETSKEKHKKAVESKENFLKVKGTLQNRELVNNSLNEENKKKIELLHDFENWPIVIKKRDKAKKLQAFLEQARIKDLYDKVAIKKKELSSKINEFNAYGEVSQEDVIEAVSLEKKILGYSASLKGLNLTAKIKQLGDNAINIKSSVDGRDVPVKDGTFKITEAIDICIPDVMELQIMPNGIDAEAISKELKECEARYNEIKEKYNVEDADELKKRRELRELAKRDIQTLKEKIELTLGENAWKSIEAAYAQLPETVPPMTDVEREIRALCGMATVDGFIGKQDSIIEEYVRKYTSGEKLSSLIEECERKIKKYNKDRESWETIPNDYASVKDPDMYEKILESEINRSLVELDIIKNQLNTKQNESENGKVEEFQEELAEKEEFFKKKKEEYSHWKHIAETVQKQKALIQTNPMQDIEEKFAKYINKMTDGKVALTGINEKLDATLTSGKNQLSYDILSEGTKDTISLALRLAILEHLFPEGGGLAVFDDPFTDMDPDRKLAACELLKEYAKNNQIIFVTCDNEYAEKLGGKQITMER